MRWVNWALHTALLCLLINRVKAFLLALMHSSVNERRENALRLVIETGLKRETAEHRMGKSKDTLGTMITKGPASRSCEIISLSRLRLNYPSSLSSRSALPSATSLSVNRHYVLPALTVWSHRSVSVCQSNARVCVCVKSFQLQVLHPRCLSLLKRSEFQTI